MVVPGEIGGHANKSASSTVKLSISSFGIDRPGPGTLGPGPGSPHLGRGPGPGQGSTAKYINA